MVVSGFPATTNGASPSTGTLFKPLLTLHLLMFLFGQIIQKVKSSFRVGEIYLHLEERNYKTYGSTFVHHSSVCDNNNNKNGEEIQCPRVEDLLNNTEHSYNGIKYNIYK